MGEGTVDFPLARDEEIKIFPYRQGNMNWHEHDCLELVYVTQGSGIHYMDNEKYRISQGDCFVIDFGSRHRYETDGEEPFDIINIVFYPELIDKSLKDCRSFREMTSNYLIHLGGGPRSRQLGYICSDAHGEMGSLVQRLCDEYGKNAPGRMQMLRCLLIELIITLMRALEEDVLPPNRHPSTEYILEYVEKNYMQPVSLGDLAARLNFSLPYVSKCFHEDMGQTFTDYLCHVRIRQSCRLLANTNEKIARIAALCGFEDSKWFYLKFRAATGTTPSRYRAGKR